MGGKFNRKIGGKSQLKNRWTKTVGKNGINIGEKFSGKIGGKNGGKINIKIIGKIS